MLRYWPRFICSLSLSSAALVSRGQAVTPLHTFFQQNYDSTIVYQSGSNWNNSPHYMILAKHQQQLEFFTYTSPYRDVLGHYYPGRLARQIAREEAHFRATIPDTNRYLLPKRIHPATLAHGWSQLQAHQLWLVQDDQQAPPTSRTCVVEDGDENTFYLIDKKTVKVARFYAPAAKEECAGKDRNRQQALKAIATLRTLLQNVQ
ncbi:hypothetical protein [Hymenobacter sp. GOD-10R]|uniref:hypothetical protein n=1 Tax=Hymenobacter sp. GOD-10R TaxID=3093922 RepID=UPI002D78ECD2|nr:hypothetical protein [Hymenobacter sp. GOD-10R]WRQ26585.1 hypothetical protein SD425_16050 [Hymenobacter sp. GOD-10R]